MQVVRHLLSSYATMIKAVDSRGNTALNIAAYRGHLAVVELLIRTNPRIVSLTNNCGDTFLHMAVSGFLTPGFRRLDRQLQLMKRLVSSNLVNMEDVVNVKNNEGRTALHMAVMENLQSQVVELLMSVRYIDLNIRDADRNTPLDLLKQRPQSASSEILIKRLIAAGGIENSKDQTTRNALVSHLRRHGIGVSPGTSFRIPDAEIFLHTGTDDLVPSSCDLTSSEYGYSGEIERVASTSTSSKYNKLATINSAAKRFKNLLLKKARNGDASDMEDDYSIASCRLSSSSKNSPISLRQQFSKQSSLPNNKRIQSQPAGATLPSPSTKKKFAAGLTHGVLQLLPKSYAGSPTSAFSESSWPSPQSADRGKSRYQRSESAAAPDSPSLKMKQKHASFNLRLMNNYFCFGAQGLAVDNSITSPRPNQNQHTLAV